MRALRPSGVLLALISALGIVLTALPGLGRCASAADPISRSTSCVALAHASEVTAVERACMVSEPVTGATWVDSFGEESDPDPDPGHNHHHPAALATNAWWSHLTDEPRVVCATPVGFRPLRI